MRKTQRLQTTRPRGQMKLQFFRSSTLMVRSTPREGHKAAPSSTLHPLTSGMRAVSPLRTVSASQAILTGSRAESYQGSTVDVRDVLVEMPQTTALVRAEGSTDIFLVQHTTAVGMQTGLRALDRSRIVSFSIGIVDAPPPNGGS